jgi:dolichol-phosphate mannosyltransferase
MKDLVTLSIFMPAYKEAQNLALLLPRLISVVSALEQDYEIIVVDTVQPMDDTPAVCSRVTGNIVYANTDYTDSYGHAVRTGIRLAKGKYFIALDADGSHDPEFISKLYPYKDDFDVVIASRYASGGGTQNSKMEIFMSRVVNIIYSIVLGLNCKDVSNSFKLYHTQDLKALYLKSNNFDIIEEILYKLKKNKKNLLIKELPFTFKRRIYGQTKRKLLLFVITYIITLLKLRFSGKSRPNE